MPTGIHSFLLLSSLGLGQQRIMPTGIHSQEKACKQEERLLAKLNTIELDSTLFHVLKMETLLLLEGENTYPHHGFSIISSLVLNGPNFRC